MRHPLAFGLGVALLAVVGAGCGALPPPLLCGEIPPGGCPIGRGGTCDDAACGALYDCVEGTWTAVTRCDRPGQTGYEAGGGDPDGGCEPVTLDHAGETTGCTPALQHPDCPVEAAETCADTACSSGCIDFFLCTEEGWREVAYCDESGQISARP